MGRNLAYHGVNFGGVSVQGLPLNQQGWGQLLAPVAQIDHDDLAKAEALFDERGDQIAAVIAEPVIGAGGVYPATVEYLRGLRKLCDEAGALLIFDEVITGFGRLGSWFAAEHYGVTPDLITFAKAVTSGYQPLGGVMVGPRVREAIEADPEFILRHGYTYSGHPTACAAAVANLAVLRDEHLLDRVPHLAQRFGDGLGRAGRRRAGGRGAGRGRHLGGGHARRGERLRRAPGAARPGRDRPTHRRRGHRLLPAARHRRRRRRACASTHCAPPWSTWPSPRP